MSFAIVRVAKRKDIASIRRCAGHHLRAAPTPNADPTRHIEILAGPSDHLEVAHQVKARTDPLVKRKDAVRGLDIFCGTSPDFFKNGGSIDDFKKHTMKWLEQTFGKASRDLVCFTHSGICFRRCCLPSSGYPRQDGTSSDRAC